MVLDSIRGMVVAVGLALALSACTSDGGGPAGGGDGGAIMPPSACENECCLALLACCRSILVNPVFFQSCNQVVSQCRRRACRDVLAGYIECEPFFSACLPDAGVPDGG